MILSENVLVVAGWVAGVKFDREQCVCVGVCGVWCVVCECELKCVVRVESVNREHEYDTVLSRLLLGIETNYQLAEAPAYRLNQSPSRNHEQS